MPTKKNIYMGTTEVPAAKTASEIQYELMRMKARFVTNEFDASGNIIAMRFCLASGADGAEIWYRLPIRVHHVQIAMRRIMGRMPEAGQAERTAWRQVLRWIQAQFALIEVDQSTPFEVFMPYMLSSEEGQKDRTLAEVMAERMNVPLLKQLPNLK